MSSITALALARAAGGNVRVTYAWPSASPIERSVSRAQRFQRGSSSLAPVKRAAEGEILVHEGRAEPRRDLSQRVKAEIRAPVGDRRRRDELARALEEVGIRDVHFRDRRREADRAKVRRPVDVRRERAELRERHRMIRRRGIAQIDASRRRFRQLRLERHDPLGVAGGGARVLAGQRQDLRDVLDVRGAQRVGRRPLIGVVVAIGQAEPRLHEPDDVVRRIVRVGRGRVREERIAAVHLHLGDLPEQLSARRDCHRCDESIGRSVVAPFASAPTESMHEA